MIYLLLTFMIFYALIRKHREKISWYTALLVAGGLALVVNFIIGFGEPFIDTFYLIPAALLLVTLFVYIWKLATNRKKVTN